MTDTILVSGGAGYIGSHMVCTLLDLGYGVLVLDNLSTGHRWAVDKRATFVKGDINDSDLVQQLCQQYGIKSVIHFAGSIIVPESVDNPLKYYSNNTAATRTLIDACIQAGISTFIFSSTAAVYGVSEDTKPLDENTPLSPISPYGRSKLMTEMMLEDVAFAHDLKVGVLRYFNVAGADPQGRTGQSTPHATHLIKVASEAALGKREKMQVYGTDYPTPDGTCLRDYIHVIDLVDAHALLLQHLNNGGDNLTLNCGYGRGTSVKSVIETVKQVSETDFTVEETNRRPGDPASVVAKADKIRATLGWTPQHENLEGIVRSALNWEKTLWARTQ